MWEVVIDKYWNARCPECNWEGSSKDCEGGGAIADTGDFDDVVCPECYKKKKWIPVENEEE